MTITSTSLYDLQSNDNRISNKMTKNSNTLHTVQRLKYILLCVPAEAMRVNNIFLIVKSCILLLMPCIKIFSSWINECMTADWKQTSKCHKQQQQQHVLESESYSQKMVTKRVLVSDTKKYLQLVRVECKSHHLFLKWRNLHRFPQLKLICP